MEVSSTDEFRAVAKLIARIEEENSLLKSIHDAIDKENLKDLNAFLSKAAEMGMDNHAQVQ